MKTRTITRGITAAVLLAALASSTAWAATARIVSATVNSVLVDAVSYGGCMASLSVSPKTLLPGCNATWVSFGCSGEGGSDAVRGYRMLDQAQLALATNKVVAVNVDDSRKFNGYCFASRIDVIK